MPELPDVEGFRRVAAAAAGQRVERVRVLDRGVLRGTTPAVLGRAVRGCTFAEPRRHGKLLLLPTDGQAWVLMHFGMTGSLHWCARDDPRHRHDRVVFLTGGGELRYRDQRKLQGIRLATGEPAVEEILAALGPDALSCSRDEFARRLGARGRQCKPALLDQAVVAGLGNLTVDETLWRARIDPRRRTDRLTDAETRRLHTAVRRVLRDAVPTGQVPDRPSWLTGHREDARCPRCRGPLRRSSVGSRSTVSCPHCQR